MIWDIFAKTVCSAYTEICFPAYTEHVSFVETQQCLFWKDTMSVVARQDLCCGKNRFLLWQDKISVAARQDLCRGKTRSLLWEDVGESTKGRGAKRRAPLWRRREAPPPLCLGTREILSCHDRDLVLPHQRSCLATTEIVSSQTRHFVSSQTFHPIPSFCRWVWVL